jgi:hypothetical protein
MEKWQKNFVSILVMFVAWKISDVLLELVYNSIDNTISQSSGNVNSLLIILRSIVGFIGIDFVSFLIAVIVLVVALISANNE